MTSRIYKYKDKYGDIRWMTEEGILHREDGPAVEGADGTKEWYFNHKRHRLDGPAIEMANGYQAWYRGGKRHRENGPAVEHTDGTKQWWFEGQMHRENGPAVEWPDGTCEYYLNGQTGPEIELQVKENIKRILAEKDQKELWVQISQDQDVFVKINTCSSKIPKKL